MTTESKDGAPRGDRRVGGLDLLRFMAAVAVMLYHYTYFFSDTLRGSRTLSPLQVVTRHGYLGVDVFFVISGFVVLWSARGRTAVEFARARALRLYPEFWLAVPISALVFSLVRGEWHGTDATNLLINLTMVPTYLGGTFVDGVYWTLAVEIKFYVLLGVLLALGQLPNVGLWLAGWLIASGISTVMDTGPIVRSLIIFPYGPLFASGGLFYLVYESGWTRWRAAGLAFGLPLCVYHAIGEMDGFVDPVHITAAAQITTAAVIVLTFAGFATVVSRESSWGGTSTVALLGALTYPLYLLHNVGRAIFLRPEVPLPPVVALVAAIVLSVALSYAVMRVGTGPVRRVLRLTWDKSAERIMRFRQRARLVDS